MIHLEEIVFEILQLDGLDDQTTSKEILSVRIKDLETYGRV